MKTKIMPVILSIFIFSFAMFSTVQAENSKNNENDEIKMRGNATSTLVRNNNASTTGNAQGKFTSETHRSVVANFVHSLIKVADREGGIGAEVREIAKSQNDSATTTTSAMVKVERKGSFRTFLFGSDYKNLGVIRSEIATTTNNIARLKLLLDKATTTTDRAELNIQIQALETELSKINAFITARENRFSLFGWFNKLFVK